MRGKAAPARVSRVYLFVILSILAGSIPLFSVIPTSSQAQVTLPITSSGLNTQVSGPINLAGGKVQYDITGGTRPGGGPNLFHSFGEFGVPTNNIANFLNETALPTPNILGRVTAGNPSNIFGTVQTSGFGNANLFLMNPAGIIFGPNATLNVGGSVNFTTADYLRLADGNLFNATPNAAADALLSAAPVAAFGFLGSNPGAITVQGSQLSVPTGQGISLVGGNITVHNGTLENGTVQPARLSAPNGQINLATAASPGEFLLPNLSGSSFTSYGSIHLAQGTPVDLSQTGNSKVSIRGGQFVLEIQNALLSTVDSAAPTAGAVGQDNMILGPGSSIITATSSADRGPDVQIVADRIEIVGIPPSPPMPPNPPTPPPFTGIRTQTSAGGKGGDITLDANSILVKSFGQLQTTTSPTGPTSPPATGNAGNISLTTNQNLELNMGLILSTSQSPTTSGNAGNINLTSTHGNILGTNFTTVTSQTIVSTGNAGTITVSAPHGDILLNSGIVFSHIDGPGAAGGSGGGVQLTANNLTLLNRSTIAGDNFNPRVPGHITVTLSGSLSLGGNSVMQTVARGPALAAADLNITAHDISVTGGSFLNTESKSSGPGGHLNIFAESLQLTDRGQLRSGSTLGVDPATGKPVIPSGKGGTITIQGLASPAGTVVVDGLGSGIFTDTVGTGAGGSTNIFAQSITLQNGGTLSAKTSGSAVTAVGGDIGITAGQSVSLSNGASMSASSTGPANAGNISINAGATLLMENSSITTQASQASGGNIEIKTSDMVQLINSQINTSVAGGAGGGGNITIDPNFVILQNSQILANAFAGPGGNITITTGVFLPDANSLVDASSQFGLSGTVTIQSPITNLSSVWARLQQNYAEVTAMLRARCAAQVSGQYSSFVRTGRDAIPLEPGGWLLSPLALEGTAVGKTIAEMDTAPDSAVIHTAVRGIEREMAWPGRDGRFGGLFHSDQNPGCVP